jgi:hypothetical protein
MLGYRFLQRVRELIAVLPLAVPDKLGIPLIEHP